MSVNLSSVGYVPLHVHSAFSLREGALKVDSLIEAARQDQMPALGITDTNNLFGALEFSEKCAKAGIQPIIGVQLTVDCGDGAILGEDHFHTPSVRHPGKAALVLLATHEKAYTNLLHIVSRAYLDSEAGDDTHVSLHHLAPFGALEVEGLIALSGGPSGPLDRALSSHKLDIAVQRLEKLSEIFKKNLFIELQRYAPPKTMSSRQKRIESALIDLAYRQSLPLVACNEAYFKEPGDYEAHDALLCISEGTVISVDSRRQLTREHYFKTRAQMVALFADLPEATQNSVAIALRCSYRPSVRAPILPKFPLKEAPLGEAPLSEEEELRRQAREGLQERLRDHRLAPGHGPEEYQERLNFELDVIVSMQFAGYFLIVADFIKWSKKQSIPVGPGRGSGAGSLVAYALTITDLDPLRFGLLFERFLNPQRISMPDFDIDFCQYRRDEVIDYVRQRYGKDRVAQIVTFGSFLARGVLRNVGRVLEVPLGQVDRLAKLIPYHPTHPITLAQAVASEKKLQESAEAEPRIANMLKIASQLEGLYSNASTHAAGIVIADRPLHALVPLYRDPKSDMPATQFNMKWVEAAGLVKFDFLGLKTLTALRLTLDLLAQRKIELNLSALPLEDRSTYTMLGRGETVGLFQVESAGMRKALMDMQPDRFEDLIALVALYRPGPMANIPIYCSRKHGLEKIEYAHPALESILKETFGVITYQEQVQQIAKELAGYDLGEADILRRAMGKKIKSAMKAQQERFLRGAQEKGIPPTAAASIFEACAKFAEYGFNKSHSAPYALITYQTAFLKANYPVEYMAALMTLDKANTDKLAEFKNEAARLGIEIAPPSVNESGVDFEVHATEEGRLFIRYALSALKGAGESQARLLVSARGTKKFTSLGDFAQRIHSREINKRILESFACAGAFDGIEKHRAAIVAATESILALSHKAQDEQRAGQSDLFQNTGPSPVVLPSVPSWSIAERLAKEYESVGFFLSGHPLDEYQGLLKSLKIKQWAEFVHFIKEQGQTTDRLAAIVLNLVERRTKSGTKLGIATLSDQSGQYEALLFQDTLSENRERLEKGNLILAAVEGRMEDEEIRVRLSHAQLLSEAFAKKQKGLRVFVQEETVLEPLSRELSSLGAGKGIIILVFHLDFTASSTLSSKGVQEVEMELPVRYTFSPKFLSLLRTFPGISSVEHF